MRAMRRLWTGRSVTGRPAPSAGAVSAPAPSPVLFALVVLFALAAVFAGPLAGRAWGQAEWTAYHHDAARSGDDTEPGEPIPPVQAWQSTNLGAPIWGQPLVLGERVYVATVGDELYALNAATGAVEWQQSAGTPVPSGELPCGDIEPTVGIVGTPVIDVAAGVIYAVADTWNAGAHCTARHMRQRFAFSAAARPQRVCSGDMAFIDALRSVTYRQSKSLMEKTDRRAQPAIVPLPVDRRQPIERSG